MLSEGATIITCTPVHPPAWNQAIIRHQANAVYMIPSKLRLLARTSPAPNPQVKVIISGSQSLGLDDIKVLESAYPKSQCTLYYGASELSFVSYIRGSRMNENPTCVGTPFPGINISIQDSEISVDTPYRALAVPSPYSAGDLGYIAQDGCLYLLGRKDNVYNIHGRKVSAALIEQALLALDEVEEAAVILKQEALTAYVVPSPSLGFLYSGMEPEHTQPYDKKEPNRQFTQMLLGKLKQSLEPYQTPRRIICVKELPGYEGGKRKSLKLL